jgi:hypothetical protein
VSHIRALLVEHEKEIDKDKLEKLYQKHWHLFKARVSPIRSNWRLDDTTMLTMTVKIMNGGYRWDIFISEGIKNNVKRSFCIDTAR